jgi:hypothetical protein
MISLRLIDKIIEIKTKAKQIARRTLGIIHPVMLLKQRCIVFSSVAPN